MKIFQWSSVLLSAFLFTLSSQAWQLTGQVRCPEGNVFKGVRISVVGASQAGAFSASTLTDSEGLYQISLPDVPGSYAANLDTSTLPPDATLVSPNNVQFDTTVADDSEVINWEIGGDACQHEACWFTGGGAKIDNILGIPAAQKGPKNSFGGNVYPGCNPTSGDGGNWNHVAHDLKLHFQGRSIVVVDCGNVTPPPPPGSTSPVTPFNFIEFKGTGTLKGISGNKVDYGTVTFFARCEDRNEPGAKDSNAGAGIDRYYLRVVDSGGTTRLLISGDADPNVVSPVEITDGNFQIHISSCDNPPQ